MIKVKVYINNIPVEVQDLHKYRVKNPTISRILNDVRKRETAAPSDTPIKFRQAEGQ